MQFLMQRTFTDKRTFGGYFYAHACCCQARVAGQEKLPSLVSSLDRIPSRSASRRCAPLEPCSNHGDLNMSTDATMREHAEHVHLPSPHRPHALSCTHAHPLLTCCSFVMRRGSVVELLHRLGRCQAASSDDSLHKLISCRHAREHRDLLQSRRSDGGGVGAAWLGWGEGCARACSSR